VDQVRRRCIDAVATGSRPRGCTIATGGMIQEKTREACRECVPVRAGADHRAGCGKARRRTCRPLSRLPRRQRSRWASFRSLLGADPGLPCRLMVMIDQGPCRSV